MSRFTFLNHCWTFSVEAVPAADRSAAFLAALHQLGSTQPPDAPLTVALDWRWRYLALEAAAHLPQLRFHLSVPTLDDTLLDSLMRHHTLPLWRVQAETIELSDTTYSAKQRPWRSLWVKEVPDASSLLCLPLPSSDGARLVEGITRLNIGFTPEQVQ